MSQGRSGIPLEEVELSLKEGETGIVGVIEGGNLEDFPSLARLSRLEERPGELEPRLEAMGLEGYGPV